MYTDVGFGVEAGGLDVHDAQAGAVALGNLGDLGGGVDLKATPQNQAQIAVVGHAPGPLKRGAGQGIAKGHHVGSNRRSAGIAVGGIDAGGEPGFDDVD